MSVDGEVVIFRLQGDDDNVLGIVESRSLRFGCPEIEMASPEPPSKAPAQTFREFGQLIPCIRDQVMKNRRYPNRPRQIIGPATFRRPQNVIRRRELGELVVDPRGAATPASRLVGMLLSCTFAKRRFDIGERCRR